MFRDEGDIFGEVGILFKDGHFIGIVDELVDVAAEKFFVFLEFVDFFPLHGLPRQVENLFGKLKPLLV